MLKPNCLNKPPVAGAQPPSGGCVLKLELSRNKYENEDQPPSGGCVLKPLVCQFVYFACPQPPSGGCVLKP